MTEAASRPVASRAPAPTAGRPAALEARGVRHRLPLGSQTVEILRGIDLAIEAGEMVALVGPSGSGKTTLLGVLAGLDRPSEGRVFIDGVDVTDLPESRLARVRNARVGMVFQNFNLIPTLTAQENVEVPLYVGEHQGSPAEEAARMLALVGLGDRRHHLPTQLSGGEQQRVAIARALVTRPAIVIADEPTGNLDAANGARILDLIVELRRRLEITFLVATHDRDVAARAERLLTIADGCLVDDQRR